METAQHYTVNLQKMMVRITHRKKSIFESFSSKQSSKITNLGDKRCRRDCIVGLVPEFKPAMGKVSALTYCSSYLFCLLPFLL